MNAYDQIMARIKRLPVGMDDLGIGDELAWIESSVDRGKVDGQLYAVVDERLKDMEQALLHCPFLEPDKSLGLGDGDFQILDTADGQAVQISFARKGGNKVVHIFVHGPSGHGKSCFQANLVCEVAPHCHTLIIDNNRCFRHISRMHEHHKFIRLSDLKLNLWDGPRDVDGEQVDTIVNAELSNSFNLKFARMELGEVVNEQRENGIPNFQRTMSLLKQKRYDKWSNRSRYRDSILIVMQDLWRTSKGIFNCAKGMNLEELLAGNIVIETDGYLPELQSFISRYLFEYIHLITLSGGSFDKHLVVVFDEGQSVDEDSYKGKMLQLRHHGVSLSVNYQNASAAPPELTTNCDCLVSFGCADQRDRAAFSSAANLTREQSENLASLEIGQCACFMPGVSASAFLGFVPRIEFSSVENSVIQSGSRDFLKQFEWVPVREERVVNTGVGEDSKKFESMVRAFLEDMANKVHEFSAMTPRFERIGCRSAAMREKIVRRLVVDGMIKVWPLGVNLRGAPIKLVELSEKGAMELGVEWKRGNERLDTRAAKELVFKKFSEMDGWVAMKEALFEGKRIDVLVRDVESRAVAFEIAGASGKHEVHNCLHNLKFDEIERHFVVCLGKRVFDEVRKRFADFPLLVGNERVEVLTLARVLSDGFVLWD